MPAAAVIPAPIAYIKVAAVKKLVVGFLVSVPLGRLGVGFGPRSGVFRRILRRPSFLVGVVSLQTTCGHSKLTRSFTVKKLECLKQA